MTEQIGTSRRILYLLGVIVVVGVGVWVWLRFGQDDFSLPRGGETTNIEVATEDGVMKEIMETDGIKHSVPLDEVIGGGPPRDGIPSIDDPKFVLVGEADSFMSDDEPGIAFSASGVDRFYPFQILVWHEIVNDTVPSTGSTSSPRASSGQEGGQRVLISYCPLCLSGIVFDPVVQGERVEFGTSGKLWQSNLVMYDRKTETLWSQVLGEAIVGDLTGTKLEILPSDQIKYGEWKKLHPNGEVLSRDTGALRTYGSDPYGDYYTSPTVFFPVNQTDDRLENKDFILGIVVGDQVKAYYPPTVKAKGEITDTFAGKTIVARYEEELDAVRIFEKASDWTLTRINPFASYWFAWVAAHPDTELYK